MNTTPYITNLPLSPEQDFKALKEKGLNYVRDHSSMAWNNLNDSDPGITIMDQLCFALSELGYCSNFSTADLLTAPNGKLKIRNQFYLPEEILTTSPVTTEDYIKYIIDEAGEVENAIIYPVQENGFSSYGVYLLLKKDLDEAAISEVCKKVLYLLNRARNLGEQFMMPAPFEKIIVTLRGSITLRSNKDISAALNNLQRSLSAYIFPAAGTNGFDTLYDNGTATEDILNGPLLKNGWITHESLGQKKDSIDAAEISSLVQNSKGFSNADITGLQQDDAEAATVITVTAGQLICIDLAASISNDHLTIYCNNRAVSKEEALGYLDEQQTTSGSEEYVIHPEVLNDKLHALPSSKYRDISSYYSIQNTFPEIYASGHNAITSNAPEHRVAQSRQLKGYLTLFDQVMANQFAQLENIDQLFSFTNSTSGDPADRRIFYAEKDKSIKGVYPVPYKSFSPTYFYQSLYTVPHIKQLLKDNSQFAFSTLPVSQQELEQESWEAYKSDPYNPYIKGLMDCVDDEETNLERRNNLLDHLLSRYGEAPLLIDAYTEDASWSGHTTKDRVIIKSLLLQNLSLLSYNRVKAANYYAAHKLCETLPELSLKRTRLWPDIFTTDFIVDTEHINRTERIRPDDFNNYAAAELKLGLLFALKPLYRNYIEPYADWYAASQKKKYPEHINAQMALWLIKERRGLILIENRFLTGEAGGIADILQIAADDDTLKDGVTVVFPAFIPGLNKPEFKARVSLFLENSLPVAVPYRCLYACSDTMQALIPAYAKWFNSMRYVHNENEIDNN